MATMSDDAVATEETAADAARSQEPEVNKLFRMVMKHEASDLHLKVGQPPMMRLKGDIRRMDMRPLTQEDMERLLLPQLDAKQRKILDEEGGVDFSYVIGQDECRFRVSLFKQRGRLSLVARRVNNIIPSFKDLGLPPTIEKLCNFPEGLVILAGVTGCGKSTTIASMLDYINEREPLHILTVEDPIEFTFTDKKSYINQREIGLDCMRLAQGPQGRGAAGPRRDPRRRVARRRDVRGRRPRGRDRPPGVRHHPRLQRRHHHQPHPRPVPARQAQRHPPGAGQQPQGGRRPEAGQGPQEAAACRPTRS